MKLVGAVAVVIGGARGIGRAYCVSLLDRNVKVICTDVLDEEGRKTEKELQEKYGADHVIYRTCNGLIDEQIRELLNFAKSHFGRVDIIVNNVGIIDESNWQKVFEFNMGTTVRVTNAVFDLMGKDKGGNGGVLVHTASNAGLVPAFFGPIYSASKAAMVFYVRSWAQKFNYESHGIRMFTMCPSLTNTPFLSENLIPTRCVKLDLVKDRVLDESKLIRPEWVGEALIKGLEDDDVNGDAIQLVGQDPVFFFHGTN